MEFSILSSFEEILREIKNDGKYTMVIPASLEHQVQMLSSHFAISARQVLLLAAVMDLCGFGSVDCEKLAQALQCNFFSFLTMKQDLDGLRNKELIEGIQVLSVPVGLIDSIVENRTYSPCNISDMSTKRIVDKLVALYDDVLEKRKSPVAFLRTADMMVLGNQSTSVAMALDRYGILCYDSIPIGQADDVRFSYAMDRHERMLFYCLLARIDQKVSWYEMSPFFSPMQIKELKKKSRANSLQLQSEGVVELICDDSSDELFFISDKVKEQILSDAGGMMAKSPFPEMICHESIPLRNLFYPESIKERIKELSTLLSYDRFVQVKNSLAEHGLRTGFAVLFHGDPGTGKTETALQIAKYTSRDVISVNVADLKEAYVGATEKNVKGVFDRYRRYIAQYRKYPILLFNEADAVLGARMINPQGAADRTENSMQNIILEEMERLDGIMIATTNLSANLDKAFDRRFLYRIRFTRPDISSMTQIIGSMLPELSDKQAKSLAMEFSLSGGQIENVCRRKTILSAIMGRPATFEEIRRICSEEFTNGSPQSKIGF